MNKQYSRKSYFHFSKAVTTFLLLISLCIYLPQNALSQVPTWYNEGFSTSPYPVSNTYFLTNSNTSWTFGEISGTVGFPNQWVYTVQSGTTPTYPTTSGGFIQSGPLIQVTNHAQFAGTGYLQFNNRSINYNNATGVAPIGDASYIASRSLDFSGHTTYNAAADTFGLWFWRDNCPLSGVDLIADSFVVYINTSPVLIGTDLVKLNEIGTGSSFIPRSSTIAPLQGPVGGGWRRCTYRLPNTPAYVGVNATSTAYIMIVAYSQGGNNMFIDDINLPEWQTNMVVQSATVFYQENADVQKGTSGNLMMGVKITTKGSATPLKIEAATFSANGSTFYAADVTNPLVYYTGAGSNFATTGGVALLSYNAVGPAPGLLNFGTWAAACTAAAPPASQQLSPGTENYIWLTYDILGSATPLHYAGADFQFITTKPAGVCSYVGSSVSATPSGILPQTFNKARLIDLAYPIGTYVGGLGVPGYWDFDCISAVYLPGDNGSQIQNYNHDDTCASCSSIHPIGDPLHQYCVRWSCHPNDYTNFQPVNAGMFKNRFVQVTAARGKRSSLAGPPMSNPYLLRVLGGNVTGTIGVFIDWNRDGDFDDTYYFPGCLTTDSIKESYGSITTGGNTAAMNQYPITIWPSGTLWTIDVPAVTDLVKDWNNPAQLPNNSINPISISNVRMRIRQAVAQANIQPFANGYIEGETEDYTLQVLDNCPNPGANICKWIGTTSDWNTPTNWCPGIPTINDIAFVPIINTASFYYPVIKSNTAAVCRQLKLYDNGVTAAQLTVDCPTNGSLTVADSLIIGTGNVNSSSQFRVNSTYANQITIPGASAVPPAGNGFNAQSPFQAIANMKTQIAYTAAELANTYGLKAGDIIDTLVFKVKTITPTIGASTWNNFRITYWSVNRPWSWGTTLPLGVDTAVWSGTVGATNKGYILGSLLGTSGITLNLNLTGSGLDSFYLALNPGKFVWDGNDLVLSFEFWQGSASARNYQIYCEGSAVLNVLNLKATPGAGGFGTNASGWTFTGWQKSIGTPAPANANISYTTSNQRPRIGFIFHRPYSKFPITIGRALVNNNPSGVPAGSSGFVAGYSRVTFDPIVRTWSSSSGLNTSTNATWNPTVQPITLAADTMSITSARAPLGGVGYVAGTSQTTFCELEVKGDTIGAASFLKQRLNSYTDTLILTSGQLDLNKKIFTLKQPDGTALNSTTKGWIRSEDGATAGTINGKFLWSIGTNTSLHTVPFGISNTAIFPLKLTTTAGDHGDVEFATYGTPTFNNSPTPVAPVNVLNMTTNATPVVTNIVNYTVDRFWYIRRSTTSAISNSLVLGYSNALEGTLQAAYTSGNMRMQRYSYSSTSGKWGWNDPTWFAGQSDAMVGNIVSVTGVGNNYLGLASDSGYIWTIVNLSPNGPLPLELINFNAKQIDKQVKVWWDVQSEVGIAKYVVERTSDYNYMEQVAQQNPIGPSTALLHYETYDEHPLKGLSYYRLKSIGIGGDETFSQFVPVNFDSNGLFKITNVSANADAGNVSVEFIYDGNDKYNYVITDIAGFVIVKGSSVAKIGANKIEIPAQLARGIYLMSVQTQQKTLTEKFRY